ncbi:MAG: type II secretion system F family protein [Dehalococcoidia bacterium]|nr:MAG: type II secretion system F family protein [Dehalococcoidia bacterium]
MWFEYVACNTKGDTTTGTLEADSERSAEQLLWQSDLTIISLSKKRMPPSLDEAMPFFFRVSKNDVVYFTRDLATLLSSGIAILHALHMLYGRTTKTSMKKVVRQLTGAIETGSPFSEACAKFPSVFSPFYLRMTRVGEEIGNIDVMLREIVIQMEKEAAVCSKVRNAMIYPAFVLALAVAAMGVMIGFVLPAMSGLFTAFGGDLPIFTRIMLGFATFVRANILYLLLGVVALVGLGWLYFRGPKGKLRRDALIWRLPLIGNINIKGTMSKLARNIAILIRGGVTITEALDLVIMTTDNAPLRDALVKVRADVHSGESLSRALIEHPVFPPLFSQVVGVGEQSGRLDSNLDVMADFYEMEMDKAIARATGMLGPTLVVVMGLVVGFIALSIITPIYSFMGQIGG